MADSNITKQALANALKGLMEEQPLEKISVSDICNRCNMNRKSFYYHFRDKYDLVNWIFDTEFIELSRVYALQIDNFQRTLQDQRRDMEIICRYFYENRNFYRRVLTVDAQNSFSSHLRDFVRPLLRIHASFLLGQDDVPEMVYDFVVDGIMCAIERWLLDKNCVSTEEFMENLKRLLQILYTSLNYRISADPQWLE